MRYIATSIIATLVASLTFMAPTAHARPDCGNIPTTKWTITNVSKSYTPTGVYSVWHKPDVPMTIQHSAKDEASVTATVSSSLSAEAGVVFGKVSATVSASVAKSFSRSQTWTTSAHIPKDLKNKYRLRLRQETRKFTATKYSLSPTCNYVKQKSGTGQMPLKAVSALEWDVVKKAR